VCLELALPRRCCGIYGGLPTAKGVKACLELALPRRCCSVYGGLPTAEGDEFLLRGYGYTVEGCIGRIALEHFEVLGRDKLGIGGSVIV
jgi:hypothetical protein